MPRAERRASRQKPSKSRVCTMCGRPLRVQRLPDAAALLRELRAHIGPRKPKRGESDAARQVAEAAYDQSRAIHAWVNVGLLADDILGVCVYCSKVGSDEEG
jgi:hypothetical protein